VEIFEKMLGDIKFNPAARTLYPFFVRVGVCKYRPPRHPIFEMVLELGYGYIENVLYHTGKLSKHLTFVFPERHISVHEQHAFMAQFESHPNVGIVKQVDIITSCPLLISQFYGESIRILTWEDDKERLPFNKS